MTHEHYCAQFIPTHGRVLDVGAGRGKFLKEMALLGFRAEGIERNGAYIDEAKRSTGQTPPIVIVEGEAEALPFEDNTYDFANCAEVTEHVNDPGKVCKEILRVLRPGAKAYVSFHNRFGIYDFHYHLWFINWMPRSWTEPVLRALGRGKEDGVAGRQKLVSMHYYSYRTLCRMLASVGFSVADVRVEKIRTKFGVYAPIFLAVYAFCLRPLYFNTFHMLLEKPGAYDSMRAL